MLMLLAALTAEPPPAATVRTPASPPPAARATAGGISVAGGATATPTRTVPSAGTMAPAVTVARPAYGPTTAIGRPAPTTATTPRLATPATAGRPRPTAPQTAAARAAQVLAAVRTEFPRYDTRRTGRLSPLEFSTWVLHANGVAVAPTGQPDPHGVKPVDAMNATARAFAAADANHDGGVTADEMAAFLTRRPAATAAR